MQKNVFSNTFYPPNCFDLFYELKKHRFIGR